MDIPSVKTGQQLYIVIVIIIIILIVLITITNLLLRYLYRSVVMLLLLLLLLLWMMLGPKMSVLHIFGMLRRNARRWDFITGLFYDVFVVARGWCRLSFLCCKLQAAMGVHLPQPICYRVPWHSSGQHTRTCCPMASAHTCTAGQAAHPPHHPHTSCGARPWMTYASVQVPRVLPPEPRAPSPELRAVHRPGVQKVPALRSE